MREGLTLLNEIIPQRVQKTVAGIFFFTVAGVLSTVNLLTNAVHNTLRHTSGTKEEESAPFTYLFSLFLVLAAAYKMMLWMMRETVAHTPLPNQKNTASRELNLSAAPSEEKTNAEVTSSPYQPNVTPGKSNLRSPVRTLENAGAKRVSFSGNERLFSASQPKTPDEILNAALSEEADKEYDLNDALHEFEYQASKKAL